MIKDAIIKQTSNLNWIFKNKIYLRLESNVIKLRILEIRYSLNDKGKIVYELLCKEIVGNDYYLLDLEYFNISFTNDFKKFKRILFYDQRDLFYEETPLSNQIIEVKKFLPIECYKDKLENKMTYVLQEQQEDLKKKKDFNFW